MKTSHYESVIALSPTVRDVLLRYSQMIVRIVHPRKIILFGSYAYGQPREDSDVDLMVIKDHVDRSKREVALVYEGIHPYTLSLDLLLIDQTTYDDHIKNGWTLFRKIANEGVVLYEQAV